MAAPRGTAGTERLLIRRGETAEGGNTRSPRFQILGLLRGNKTLMPMTVSTNDSDDSQATRDARAV